jgi:hypothetical protein
LFYEVEIEQYFAIQSKLNPPGRMKFKSVDFSFWQRLGGVGKSRYYRTRLWTRRKGSFHLGLAIGQQRKILQESVESSAVFNR